MAETQKPASTALKCIVVTPERAVLDEAADFVALPMYDGELGVLPGRAPLIGRLGFGELRVRQGAATQHYYVDGGFAHIQADIVTVLTGKAIPAAELSGAAAEQALAAALKPATGDALDFALKQQARARAQLRMVKANQAETGRHPR
jgi:F-type H+-transporting ATPase subunit epsilon